MSFLYDINLYIFFIISYIPGTVLYIDKNQYLCNQCLQSIGSATFLCLVQLLEVIIAILELITNFINIFDYSI